MKKKLPIIIVIIVLLYAIIFAIVMLITISLPSAVYNDQKLLAGIDSSNKINYQLSIHDGTTTVNCGKMTGMDTLWKCNADSSMNLNMRYTLQVTKGKAKLILVDSNDMVTTLVEQDSANDSDLAASAVESTVELNIKKGANRIKIVCEKSTSFSLFFSISE